MIVPTGVGAKIGGFAGDASQVARKIANEFGLIVNPNVVNAAHQIYLYQKHHVQW